MKNSQANRRQQRARRARCLIINLAIVRADKAKGCSFCPRKDPALLQYDHLDGKTKVGCIANMTRGSTDRLIAEINKCRLVCTRCHRERHLWENQIAAKGGDSHA